MNHGAYFIVTAAVVEALKLVREKKRLALLDRQDQFLSQLRLNSKEKEKCPTSIPGPSTVGNRRL